MRHYAYSTTYCSNTITEKPQHYHYYSTTVQKIIPIDEALDLAKKHPKKPRRGKQLGHRTKVKEIETKERKKEKHKTWNTSQTRTQVTNMKERVVGDQTYRHVNWLSNHEQRQKKVGRPSEGCPCYYVHCLPCTSSRAQSARNQNNMPVSFACRRTSWLQSCVGWEERRSSRLMARKKRVHKPGMSEGFFNFFFFFLRNRKCKALAASFHRLDPGLGDDTSLTTSM